MRQERFQTPLLEGHKGAAVEVPFDPGDRWAIPARQLWRGRRGHEVRGRLNGVDFESQIVPRSGKFFMLVRDELQRAAGAGIGDVVRVVVEPAAAVMKPRAPRRRRKPGSR
jgi:hypothetical protein